MQTILVTAGSGSAGRNCVEALLTKGFDVVTTAREVRDLSFSRDVEVRSYNADGGTDFDVLFKGIDAVVLIGPPLDGMVDKKLAPFIAAAADMKIRHLVYLSGNYLSGLTGGTLDNSIARKVELQIVDSGLKNTIVRAGFFMDNYTTGFYSPMIERGTIALATGNGKSALVAGADVGAFIAAALARGLTGKYLVTGPEALDHYEVAELLSQRLRRTITYTPLSEAQLGAYYASRSLNAESVEYGLTLYRAYRNHATAAVTDGFRQATGSEPMSFKAFLGLA
jgi:uncharacterized protein YbjT (DUF2867 family)